MAGAYPTTFFCFKQRLSFLCDTQKWESVATRLNFKYLVTPLHIEAIK